MKTTAIIVAVICVATVVSELLGLGFLWYRGQLNSTTVAEMRLALAGEEEDSLGIEEAKAQDKPSNEDYAQQRVSRILELGTREEELNLLKRAVTDHRKKLTDEWKDFDEQKQKFEDQLEKQQEVAASLATEQTRGILLALQPTDAIDNLMALPTEENVVLLKGMPEKSIAKMLQQFLSGEENERVRGQDIFKAISQGDPSRSLIDGVLDGLTGQPPAAN